MSVKSLEERVFANYRSALRSFPRSASSRSGERKQRALKVAAGRYKLPISQVKDIVRMMDDATGITHDHPESYVKLVEFQKQAEVLMAGLEDDMACPKCSQVPVPACKVTVYVDPTEEKLNQRMVPLVCCYLCFRAAGGSLLS